jgi:hypothetical protein
MVVSFQEKVVERLTLQRKESNSKDTSMKTVPVLEISKTVLPHWKGAHDEAESKK